MTAVEKLLNSKDYDIRKSNDARFMDQKCTPDVVCIISDCVMNLRESEPEKEFIVQDIPINFVAPTVIAVQTVTGAQPDKSIAILYSTPYRIM